MSRIAYVNGRYLPLAQACVNVEDRGYQFSDGVYEVCEVRGGRLVDERRHIERLQRSLSELRIALPMTPAALGVVLRETVRRNRVRWGIVYLQITRGVVLEVLAEQGLELVERAFTLEEAHGAREAFLTSASQIVIAVVRIDGRPVGNGAPGLIATALRRNFHRHAEWS
jgi:branched-subunit amino acid aminotransferase/4-amino-4-deoxychorismate lyase